jgi:hypothetical protein
MYLNPYLQAIPICFSPLVYHFVLWSLTFVKAYILSYLVIKHAMKSATM